MVYVSWQDHVYHASDWPPEYRDAYVADPPVFDVATGEAARDHGRIPERLRTWPGAQRSDHPEASVVAVGARADELTRDHPHDDAYGPDSPFARLVAAEGQVLMLAAPLETITPCTPRPRPGAASRTRSPLRRRRDVPRTYTDNDTRAPCALQRPEPRRRRVRGHRPRRAGRRHRHRAASAQRTVTC
jgi:hypothetical protein